MPGKRRRLTPNPDDAASAPAPSSSAAPASAPGTARGSTSGAASGSTSGSASASASAAAAAPRRRTRAPLLSIVVPTRNEAPNVLRLWDELNATLQGTEFEVCFVDDSDDATPTILMRLEEANAGRVRCRYRTGTDRAGGLATAVVEGLRLAAGRYVCVMDADLQHRPTTIPAMLAAARAGADLVVASRYTGTGSSRGLSGVVRRAVSRLSALLAQLVFSEARRSSDPLSGFFLCRRQTVDGIEFRPVGFKILLELLVCLPGLRVADVPLDFAPRNAGESKASLRQGLLFLRHLTSLFFQVEGSARFWKFAIVGLSGLVLFTLLLTLFAGPAAITPPLAFWLAFAPSVAWNTALNSLWTYADVRRRRIGRAEPWRYLARALVAAVIAFAVFVALWQARLVAVPVSGIIAALVAMLINGLTNRRATRRPPALWTDVSANSDINKMLAQLARRVSADRAYLLPPRRTAPPAGVPMAFLERVVSLRRAGIWTEAMSHRPQRRTNIDITATLLLPIVNGGVVVGIVVFERRSPRGFPASALATATGAVERIVPLLVNAAGIPEARRYRAMARHAESGPAHGLEAGTDGPTAPSPE